MRRSPLRLGHVDSARRFRKDVRLAAGFLLARGHPAGTPAQSRCSIHGRGLLGSGNGSCNRRASVTPTISGCTIAFGKGTRVRHTITSVPIWASKESQSGFWRTMTSPEPPAHSHPETHQAAATLTFLCPGLRFIHQGQMDGLTKRIPVHLSRGRTVEQNSKQFYDRLFQCLRHPSAKGEWQMLECTSAWDETGPGTVSFGLPGSDRTKNR